MPVAQKYIAGSGWPSGRVTAETTAPKGPCDAGLEHRDHRDDGQEDAGEELGHLRHRRPGELVGGMHLAARVILSDSSVIATSPTSRTRPGRPDRRCRATSKPTRRLPDAAQQHEEHDAAQQPEIDGAVEADAAACRASGRRAARLPCGSTSGRAHRTAPAATPTMNSVSGRMLLRRPEEIDALQEAQEQRRIAQRRERAAGVRHDEDEEHDHVRLVHAVVVGADQRPDQQHRGAGRAHAGSRARRRSRGCAVLSPGVPCRLPRMWMPPATANSAVSRMMNGMYSASSACTQLRARQRRAVDRREGQQEGQRPGGRHLAVVVVPERRRQQRHQRDRQQDARERQAPQRRQAAAVEIGGDGQ